MTEFDEDDHERANGRKVSPGAARKPVDLIANRLRDFYVSVTEEGTPDHLLELLDKLHEAEKKARAKKEG